ncbi:MAG: succinylglutamate desuccinylase/aspartoacylase family protein [Pseudomonadota bacterium]
MSARSMVSGEPTRAEAELAWGRLHQERTNPAIPWRDLSAYRKGNNGVSYCFTFDSGRSGPHLVITGLTHGNEPSGREAILMLLDKDVRPLIGKLSLCLMNIDAAHGSNGVDPYGIRFLDDDLNRVWDDAILDGDGNSREVRRARELRPLIASADRLLDIHSTPYEAAPFYILDPGTREARLAEALGGPRTFVTYGRDSGSAHRATVVNYVAKCQGSAGLGIGVESGLFFAAESAACAKTMAARFLHLFGVISAQTLAELSCWSDSRPKQRLTLLFPEIVQTNDIALLFRPETYAPYAVGAIVGYDGDRAIRAPFDGAVPMWLKQTFEAGVQGFMWARKEPGECEAAQLETTMEEKQT